MVCGPRRPNSLRCGNDLLNGELPIDETIFQYQVSGNTKTEGSRANVPLSPELQSALRFHILEEELTEFLFPSAAGTAMSPDNFLDWVLKPLGKEAGIANLYHQILRRTAARTSRNEEWSRTLKRSCARTMAQTTLKHYQKVLIASHVTGVTESVGRSRQQARKISKQKGEKPID